MVRSDTMLWRLKPAASSDWERSMFGWKGDRRILRQDSANVIAWFVPACRIFKYGNSLSQAVSERSASNRISYDCKPPGLQSDLLAHPILDDLSRYGTPI